MLRNLKPHQPKLFIETNGLIRMSAKFWHYVSWLGSPKITLQTVYNLHLYWSNYRTTTLSFLHKDTVIVIVDSQLYYSQNIAPSNSNYLYQHQYSS